MPSLSRWKNVIFALFLLFSIIQLSVWSGCRPTEPEGQEMIAETTQSEPTTDGTDADAGTNDKKHQPEKATPEPAPPEPTQPEPSAPDSKPKDEKPPISDKVLVNGSHVTIVHVIDGDTVYVVKKPGGWASKIRIKGIDSPECDKKATVGSFHSCYKDKDFFGLAAYKIAYALAKKEFRKVTIVCKEKNGECETDRTPSHRYLVFLRLDDGRDFATSIVRAGGAFTYTSFPTNKEADLCRAEADAIREKKGMWSQGRAVMKTKMSQKTKGWYYRKRNGHDSICSKAMKESFAKRAGE